MTQHNHDPDPGPGLQTSPAPRLQRPWKQYAALLACLLLILFGSLQYGRVLPATAASAPLQELLTTLQNEHLGSKQELLKRYKDSQPLYAGWRSQMDQLEQAEQQIYNALRKQPADPALLKLLQRTRQQQLQLIDRVFARGAGAVLVAP
jgi:hypothetical protein